MAMITSAHVVPAVNHVASSTLPTLLMPENKYASIYLLSAGDQVAASKRPQCQSVPTPTLIWFLSQNQCSGLQHRSKIPKSVLGCKGERLLW